MKEHNEEELSEEQHNEKCLQCQLGFQSYKTPKLESTPKPRPRDLVKVRLLIVLAVTAVVSELMPMVIVTITKFARRIWEPLMRPHNPLDANPFIDNEPHLRISHAL